MKTSFMYHCLGIREQECTRVRYEGGTTIFEIRTREDKFYCPKCGSRHVIKSGSTVRRFRSVPIGSRPVILEMTVQRLECKDCGAVQQEHVHFARGKQRYSYKFKRFALDLGLKPLMTAADTFQRHRDGILAWYDYRINNGKLGSSKKCVDRSK